MWQRINSSVKITEFSDDIFKKNIFFEHSHVLPQKTRYFQSSVTGELVDMEQNKKFSISLIHSCT
jgi:S-adenosylmethionine hydrolase